MSSFNIYDLEENDILIQYELNSSSNSGNNSFTVFNLDIIEGVNQLDINGQDDLLLAIGYTPITDAQVGNYNYYFFKNNNYNWTLDLFDPNILTIPDNATIKNVTFQNVKGGPIIDNICYIKAGIVYNIPNPPTPVTLYQLLGSENASLEYNSQFNEPVLSTANLSNAPKGQILCFVMIDSTSNLLFNPTIYQLQINVYYTL
jgi:hypothetical protein